MDLFELHMACEGGREGASDRARGREEERKGGGRERPAAAETDTLRKTRDGGRERVFTEHRGTQEQALAHEWLSGDKVKGADEQLLDAAVQERAQVRKERAMGKGGGRSGR